MMLIFGFIGILPAVLLSITLLGPAAFLFIKQFALPVSKFAELGQKETCSNAVEKTTANGYALNSLSAENASDGLAVNSISPSDEYITVDVQASNSFPSTQPLQASNSSPSTQLQASNNTSNAQLHDEKCVRHTPILDFKCAFETCRECTFFIHACPLNMCPVNPEICSHAVEDCCKVFQLLFHLYIHLSSST